MSEESQERTLGRMEAVLSHIVQQQTALTATVARIEAAMALKSESLAIEGVVIKNRIEELEKAINAAEPALKDLRVWKERGRGAIMLGAFLMASFGATVATFWAKLVNIVSGHS